MSCTGGHYWVQVMISEWNELYRWSLLGTGNDINQSGMSCTGGHYWEQEMIAISVESVKGLKINTSEMNTSLL
jgi:hypothetical protein